MALTAKLAIIPVNDKLYGLKHLPGCTTKIFANPEVISACTVHRRNCTQKQFSGICNG
jgi:hypothetical protein